MPGFAVFFKDEYNFCYGLKGLGEEQIPVFDFSAVLSHCQVLTFLSVP
jgi:hypothetical protein